jgi:hypothetical protein
VLLEVAVVLLQLGHTLRKYPGVIRRLLPRQNNRVDEGGHPAVSRRRLVFLFGFVMNGEQLLFVRREGWNE